MIAVSDAYKLAPFADVLYSCDARWWRLHGGVPEFGGSKHSFQKVDTKGVEVTPLLARSSAPHPALAVGGGNSGYQAVLLAVRRQRNPIILLGFDCLARKSGKTHFHGDHPRPLKNPAAPDFGRWVEAFNRLAPALHGLGIEVINCSRETALTCFPRKPLEDVLALS